MSRKARWVAPRWFLPACGVLFIGAMTALWFMPGSRGPYAREPTTTTINATASSRCFTASQAWNEIGQSGCVQFNVGYTYVSSAGNAYLDQFSDYSTGVAVWIPAGYSFGAGDTIKYANQTIRVSGVITSYEGAPQIEVTSPSQISLVG
jgi:hypothetical protein